VPSRQHVENIHSSLLLPDVHLRGTLGEVFSLRVDVKCTKERTNSRLREFQRDNQRLRDELANLQAQLHQQELWHDHELAIAL
jgi:hypothetical protein